MAVLNATMNTAAASNATWASGDVNGDGKVDSFDAQAMSMMLGDGLSAPPAPAGLAVGSITSNAILLDWASDGDATGYTLYRRPAAVDQPFVPIATTQGALAISDVNLPPGTTYQYQLTASNPAGISPVTMTITATTLSSPDPLDQTLAAAPAAAFSPSATLLPAAPILADPDFVGPMIRFSAEDDSVAAPLLEGAPVINGDNPNGLYTAAGQPSNGKQRSMVEDLVYTFSEAVTIPNVSAAFTVDVAGGNGAFGTVPATLTATSVPASDGAQWAVTVSGQSAGTLASIANGNYLITINPAAVFAAADGVTPLTAGRSDEFFRLFGDINGDGVVNATDNLRFKQALTTYNAAFDYDGNGAVNAADNLQFKNSLSLTLPGDGFGLSVVGVTSSTVSLAWATDAPGSSDPPGSVTYTLLRKGPSDSGFVQIVTGLTDPNYVDTTVSSATTYQYEVIASDAGGNSPASMPVSTLTAPAAPTGLAVTGVTPATVSLTWSPSFGATSYSILREAPGQTMFTLVGTTSGTTFTDSGLQPNTSYQYTIYATNAGGNSDTDTPITATTAQPPAPGVPTGLAVTATTVTSISLSWNATAWATEYFIVRTGPLNNPTTQSFAIYTTSFSDTSVQAGETYQYQVQAYDHAGTSALSAYVTATVPEDTQPPQFPSAAPGQTVVAASDDGLGTYVDLTWSAATDNVGVVSYEILRSTVPASDNSYVQVGTTTATTFFDSGLDPQTSYTYQVIAFDAADNESTPAQSNTVTPAATQTPPSPPIDLQATAVTSDSISLSWVQPASSAPIVGYNVYLDGATTPLNGSSLIVLSGSAPAPVTYIASVTPPSDGSSYTHTLAVEAVDTAGNVSSQVSIMATTPQGAATLDQAPDQYIPQDWQDYFYNTLTPALRQRIVAVPNPATSLTVPAAAGWLDLTADMFLQNKPVAASNLFFVDLNANGTWDPATSGNPGETLWEGTSTYEGQGVLAGSTVPSQTTGRGGVYIIDKNGTGVYASNDVLVPRPALIQGTTGTYAYEDIPGIGKYQLSDPVWEVSGDSPAYEPDDDTMVTGTAPAAGTWGKTNGIYYYDVNGSSSNRIIWVDTTTFRQDLVAFYNALDNLIPYYNITAGQMLSAFGTTNGTVPIDIDSAGNISATDGVTPLPFVTGDNLQINGQWYPVVSGDSLGQVDFANYSGSQITGLTGYSIANWTLIPAETDSDTGLQFSYQRGEPTTQSLIFPQQFTELETVLNQLTTYPQIYSHWLFDSTTSQEFITDATTAINAYTSLFLGTNGTTTNCYFADESSLSQAIQSGDADPGSLDTRALLTHLQNVVQAVAKVVGVRLAGGPQGWQQPASAGANSDAVLLFGSPEGKQDFLPGGDWYLTPGVPDWILSDHLNQVDNFLGKIVSNGLWISKGSVTYTSGYSSTDFMNKGTTDYSHNIAPGSVPALDGWPSASTNSFSNEPYVPALNYNDDGVDPGHSTEYYFSATSVFVTASLPDDSNANGGTAVGVMQIGPATSYVFTQNEEDGAPIPATLFSSSIDIAYSSWTWGLTGQTLFSVSAAQEETIDQTLFSDFADNPTSTNLVWARADGFGFTGYAMDSLHEADWQNETGFDDSISAGVFGLATAPKSVWGLVPDGNSFSYTKTHSAPPSPPMLIDPPSSPLPLTTKMDYLNVVPDNPVDGIVQTPTDLTPFGNDTGVISLLAQEDMPQAYIPIFTATGTLPINGYLTQGAFGTSTNDVGTLTSDAWTFPDENQDGVPYAYSLDTHIRLNMLVTEGGNEIKRVEVIRPGGNAVVFDFTWNASDNQFDPVGYPLGWNSRDQNQTYVLRKITDPQSSKTANDDTSLAYELMFQNGIVQTFNATGYLVSVSNSGNGLSEAVSYTGYQSGGYYFSSFVPTEPFPGTGAQDSADSSRYNITVNWQNGLLASFDYQTKTQSLNVDAQTIHTAIGYASTTDPMITSLAKTDGGTPIAEFSYSAGGGTLTHNGITVSRSGSVASGSVSITVSLPTNAAFDPGSSTTETWGFNSDRLVTSDDVSLTSGGTTTDAVTTYQYQSGDRYDNGSPMWAKVTQVTNPDGSWVSYQYDSHGWVSQMATPFKDGSSYTIESYDYDPADAVYGQAPDPAMLVADPRRVIDQIDGVQVGETFNRFNNVGYGAQVITRTALTNSVSSDQSTAWAQAGFQTVTTVYDSYGSSTTTSASGSSSQSNTPAGSSASSSWLGTTLYSSNSYNNFFGFATSSSTYAIGASGTETDANTADAFGRVTHSTTTGGLVTTATYGANDWFGPSQTTGADGDVTQYTYTPRGQVATKVIYAGTQHSVEYSCIYDAMGNVVSLTTTAVDSSGNPIATTGGSLGNSTNTYQYDVQGRLLKEVDNAGGTDGLVDRTTGYAYDDAQHTTTITYPQANSSDPLNTEVDTYYLDGSLESVSGVATTPSSYDEGVIASPTTDATGGTLTAGSTWTESTDANGIVTTTYTNVLGEVCVVEISTPSKSAASDSFPAYTDATTAYDGNGRAIKQVDASGTATYTIYGPTTGLAELTWVDENGNGVFDSGTDAKTITRPNDSGGSDVIQFSTNGNQDTFSHSSNGGLTADTMANGQDTSTVTTMGSGGYTVTTENPDGTQVVDTYTDGLLTQETTYDDADTPVTTTSYTYDHLRRMISSTDSIGATQYAYFQDGSLRSTTDPAGHVTSQSNLNPLTGAAQTTTRPDGTTQSQTFDSQGDVTSQSGAGVLPATFGYDTTGTGNLTSVTTYQSNVLGGSGAATTQWAYDPTTGDLQSETYADGTQDAYHYNEGDQLTGMEEPGVDATFEYDNAGNQTDATYTDTTGNTSANVESKVIQQNDLFVPKITQDTDNGQTFDTTDAFTPQGDLQSESFGSAANASVNYGYYPTVNTPSNGSPDAESLLTINAGGSTAQQTYSYDGTTKRFSSIIVNGITISYNYLPNSDQIGSITVGNVTTTLTPDTADKTRLRSISVTDGGNSLYSATLGYNQLDQITSEGVVRTDVADDGTTTSESTSDIYGYDATHADALTSATASSSNSDDSYSDSYSYDGAGNFTGNSALGTANSVNEYSNLTYNGRGDLTNNGTYTMSYDAEDRLISVRPDNLTTGSVEAQYVYDGQGRMVQEQDYTYDGSWVLSATYHYLYDGDEMVAKLDGNNDLLQQYTWGPGANGSDQVILLTDYSGSSPKKDGLVYDASGNVTMMVNPITGAVVADYAYAAFGALVSATGPDAALNQFRAKGYWTDAAVGPNLGWAKPATAYGANRVVDLNFGIWVQRDPSGTTGGLNATEDLGDDPINQSDGSGLAPGTTPANDSGYRYEFNNPYGSDAYGPSWVRRVPVASPTVTVVMPFTEPFARPARSDDPYYDYAPPEFWIEVLKEEASDAADVVSSAVFEFVKTVSTDSVGGKPGHSNAFTLTGQIIGRSAGGLIGISEFIVGSGAAAVSAAAEGPSFGLSTAGVLAGGVLVGLGTNTLKNTFRPIDYHPSTAAGDVGATKIASRDQVKGMIGEQNGYAEALANGEIGIQPPGNANAPGPDYITLRLDSNATATIKVYDAKFANGPKALSPKKLSAWMTETRDAINAMREGPLKDMAIAALNAGRVEGEIYIYQK
jgi:YD repeat-containing protein